LKISDEPRDGTLGTIFDEVEYAVQLDAVDLDSQESIRSQIYQLDTTVISHSDPLIATLEGENPLDTEFTILKKDIKRAIFGKNSCREAFVGIYKDLRNMLLIGLIKMGYQTIEYDRNIGSHKSKQILMILNPENLPTTKDSIGFILQGFQAPGRDNVHTMSFVPQVTFECELKYAFNIIKQLFSITHENVHNHELSTSIKKMDAIRGIFKSKNIPFHKNSNVESFVFLATYFYKIIKNNSKQKLAVALRHYYMEIYGSLTEYEQKQIDIALKMCRTPGIKALDERQNTDFVHKFPYDGTTKRVLIEYRLFSYVINEAGYELFNFKNGKFPKVRT
jgi:hypothetical protein